MAKTAPAPVSETPISFTLPQVSVKYIRELLNTVSWATTIAHLKPGGDAFELLPEPATEPVDKRFWESPEELAAYRAAVKEWADKPVKVTLSPKQHRAVKACLDHYFSKPQSVLPAGKYTNAIIDAFGITVPDDDDTAKSGS